MQQLEILIKISELILEKLSGNSSSGVYNSTFPSNITVGGIPSGENLTGLTWQQIIEKLTVTYLSPVFSSFTITGQSTIIEVGTALSGNKTFTWATTNPSNITPNSLFITDVTAATNIATGLLNDGTEVVNIGTITNTSPITRQWRISGINTKTVQFNSSNFSVSSIYPVFYGVSNTLPVADQALINSGTKSVVSSIGTVNLTFGASNQYLWFAIPQTSTDKIKWYVNALNNGNIGTGLDLFNNDVIVSISSPTSLWSNVNYRIYISNYPTTTTGGMELRDS